MFPSRNSPAGRVPSVVPVVGASAASASRVRCDGARGSQRCPSQRWPRARVRTAPRGGVAARTPSSTVRLRVAAPSRALQRSAVRRGRGYHARLEQRQAERRARRAPSRGTGAPSIYAALRVGNSICQNPPSRRVRAGGDAVEGCPRTLAGPPTGAVRRRFSASSAAEDTPPRSARPLGEVGECLTLPRTPAPSARTRASVCALWAVPWARGHAPRAGG